MLEQGTPVQVTTNVATKPSKAEATAAKKDAAAAAKLQKELSKQVTVKAKTKAVSTPGPAAPAQQSPAAGALHYMQPITISSQPSVKNLTPRSTPPQPQPLTKDPNLPSKSEPLRKEPSAPSKPEPLQKEPSVPSKPLHGILKGQQSGTPPVNSPALTPQTSGEPSGLLHIIVTRIAALFLANQSVSCTSPVLNEQTLTDTATRKRKLVLFDDMNLGMLCKRDSQSVLSLADVPLCHPHGG